MAELTMDVFAGTAFSTASITNWVNYSVPFYPSYLTSLGITVPEGITTVRALFDETAGAITLIPSSPRGSAPSRRPKSKGGTRSVETAHFARAVEITVDEVRNRRVPGGATAQMTAMDLVNERVAGPTGIKADWSYTLEHMFMGMIDGLIVDCAKTEIIDCFKLFGLSRPATREIDFGAFAADDRSFSALLLTFRRALSGELRGLPGNGAQVVVLCGDNFYDACWSNKEVTAAAKLAVTGNMAASTILSQNELYGAFRYGECNFVNYHGSDDGLVTVPADEARVFLLGVPGLFRMFLSPGDTWETADGPGLPLYMERRLERQTSTGIEFAIQSNPLPICMRPRTLLRLKKKA